MRSGVAMLGIPDFSQTIVMPKRQLPENMACMKKVTYESIEHYVPDPEDREAMQLSTEIYAVYNQYNCIIGICEGYERALEFSLEKGFLRPYLIQ